MIYSKINAFQAHTKLSCLFLYEKDYLNGCRSTFSNKSPENKQEFGLRTPPTKPPIYVSNRHSTQESPVKDMYICVLHFHRPRR